MSIHIISDKALQRPQFDYVKTVTGYVGYPKGQLPEIVWNHIDGPLLHYRDGQLHWLTWRERFRCWMGWDNAESIEAKRRPDLCADQN